MNDTAERRKQVAFVDYLSVGQSLMVKKGNPKKINTLTSLSGKSVSVEVGTTNKQFLDAESKLLVKKGKPAIKVVTFPKDTDAASALKTGRVDTLLRRLAGRRVLHQAGLELRVRRSTGQPDPGRDRDPERRRTRCEDEEGCHRDVRRRDDEEDPRQVADGGLRPQEVIDD